MKLYYSYRDEYDRVCATKSNALSRPNQDRMLQYNHLPRNMTDCITATSEEVFGVSTPREFQYVGAHHTMMKDDTVLAVPQKNGKWQDPDCAACQLLQEGCHCELGTSHRIGDRQS